MTIEEMRQEIYDTVKIISSSLINKTDFLYLVEGAITNVDSFNNVYSFQYNGDTYSGVSLTGETFEKGDLVYILFSNVTDVKKLIVTKRNRYSSYKIDEVEIDFSELATKEEVEELRKDLKNLQTELNLLKTKTSGLSVDGKEMLLVRLKISQSVNLSPIGGSWIVGKNNEAPLDFNYNQKVNHYNTAARFKMANGDVISLGGIENSFGFHYFKSNRTENGVDGKFYLDTASGKMVSTMNVQGPRGDFIAKADLLDMVYPVGAVYISTVNVSPASFLGGAWTPHGVGRTLVGVDTSDTDFNASLKTGGAKTVTLQATQIPAHSHSGTTASGGAHTHTVSGTAATAGLHSHNGYNKWTFIYDHVSVGGGSGAWAGAQASTYMTDSGNHTHSVSGTAASAGAHTHKFTTGNTGGGGAHSNLQPYITVYMFRRTS